MEVDPSRCRRCGSTEKKKLAGADRELEYPGKLPDGRPYTHVVWKRYQCASCGQVRVEKVRENRSA